MGRRADAQAKRMRDCLSYPSYGHSLQLKALARALSLRSDALAAKAGTHDFAGTLMQSVLMAT